MALEAPSITFPKGVEILKSDGFSIVTIEPDLIKPRLARQIYAKELEFAQRVVGDDIKKQAAHTIFYAIDAFNTNESQFSKWHLGIKDGRVTVVAMERSGREHQRRRFHCEGKKEDVIEFLATLPTLLKEPEEIALVLNASDFTPEEVTGIYRDHYNLDSSSVKTYIRAYVDHERFNAVPIPKVPANIDISRIRYHRIMESSRSEKILEGIRKFYRQIYGGEYSFKSRSLRTRGAYYDARNQFTRERLGIGGIIAQDTVNGIMPLSMGGDLAVAENARGLGIGLVLRWITYASVFHDPRYRDGIVTSYFTDNNEPSKKIIFDHLGGVEVSRSLWAVLRKPPKAVGGK